MEVLYSKQHNNLHLLNVIDEYNVIRDGSVKANFYEDCAFIPDQSELNVEEKNLLILYDCFLGKQNKAEAHYTRGIHNNCNTFYISQNYFRLPRITIRENANLTILFPQDATNIIYNTQTSVMMICRMESLRDSVKMCGVLIITTLLSLILQVER